MEKKDQARAAVGEAQAIIDAADRVGRELTSAEREAINEKLSKSSRLRTAAALDEGVREFGRNMMGNVSSVTGGDVGTKFVSSEGYKRIADPGARTQSFSSGLVE